MKAIREFGLMFLAVALVARLWPTFWGIDVDREGPIGMGEVVPLFGLAVSLCFAAHLMPARIGKERMADRQGQLGPSDVLHSALGVLAGAAMMGGWGGPLGLGVAVAGLAIAGRWRKAAGDGAQ